MEEYFKHEAPKLPGTKTVGFIVLSAEDQRRNFKPELNDYRKAKKRFLKDAQRNGNLICNGKALIPHVDCCSKLTVHHAKGRAGALIKDERHFVILCHTHHVYVHQHPEEAISLGLLHPTFATH